MPGADPSTPERRTDLAAYLRGERESILAEWEAATRRIPGVDGDRHPWLADFAPQLLNWIGALGDALAGVEVPEPPPLVAERPMLEHLGDYVELSDAIIELSLLRDCILRRWPKLVPRAEERSGRRVLNQAIDRVILDVVEQHYRGRDHFVDALDRVSTTALEARSVDELLHGLIVAVREEVPEVDVVAILLYDGDHLKMRAATGMRKEEGPWLPRSSGFAERVVAAKRPIEIEAASSTIEPERDAMLSSGVKTLYGIPLFAGKKVIGVAKMGSFSARGFSDHDRALFGSLTSRAASAIQQHVLRDATERRAEELEKSRARLAFLSKASEILGSTLDVDQILAHAADLAVPAMADWCAVELAGPDGLLEPVAIAHRDPDQVKLVRELRRRYPPRPDAASGSGMVMRTGKPELVRELDLERFRQTAVDEAEVDIIRQLGIRSYLCVPLRFGARTIGALTMATAETGRTLGEEDLDLAQELARRASVAIEKARLHEESERAVSLRDRILAVVSHDLRTPLSTIDLASNMLLGNQAVRANANATRQVELVQRSSRRASRLISDLLDVSSIQVGKLSLELSRCELGRVLRETVDAHRGLAREREIDLRCEIDLADRRVSCDRDRIAQALSNLIDNALKFCSSGDAITVRARARDGEILVSVADSGPGIAEDQLEHIFDLYWKARRGKQGTGLGLHITKGIIESHAGRIWCESRLGEGSTFFFTLPCPPHTEVADDDRA